MVILSYEIFSPHPVISYSPPPNFWIPPAIPENHDPQHLAHTSVIPRPQRELWGVKTMHYHLLLSFEHESGLKRHFVLNWAHSKANKFFSTLTY